MDGDAATECLFWTWHTECGQNYTVAKKSKLPTFVHIFAKYSPIFKIFSPAYSVENL